MHAKCTGAETGGGHAGGASCVGAFVGTVTTGTSGGFTGTVPARAGDRVCAVAHNTGPIVGSADIGCIALAVAVDPVGAVDQFDRSGTDLVLKGWAVDGDTAGALDLHVYQDGAFTGSARADGPLAVPPAGYPEYGTAHGYTIRIPERGTGRTRSASTPSTSARAASTRSWGAGSTP
ncbi:hypothetical protein GCM10009827_117460 [Dactylosporangium maewongense]|uniref:Uncharacterized protein n=1 Tax=Dactylosporangium maewongense TaxID=634393 RepID=A0ABP4PEX3_9ACTN